MFLNVLICEAVDDETAGMIIVILLLVLPSSLSFWPFVERSLLVFKGSCGYFCHQYFCISIQHNAFRILKCGTEGIFLGFNARLQNCCSQIMVSTTPQLFTVFLFFLLSFLVPKLLSIRWQQHQCTLVDFYTSIKYLAFQNFSAFF